MGYKLYSRVMEDCKGALLGAVAAIVTDSNSTLLWVQVRRIVVHLEEAPSHVSSLVAPVRSMKDLWTHLKAVNNQELNPMVDGHMMARWDPMILEASIPSVPPLPMPAKGCGL
jgi:ligand-binding sensor domain-containing protein